MALRENTSTLDTKIYMSDTEINDRIKRQGGVSQDSIQVLAELNNVSLDLMAQYFGFETIKDAPVYVDDSELYMKLYKQGLTDTQIAETIHMSRMPIRTWRAQNNLPPNKFQPLQTGGKRSEG